MPLDPEQQDDAKRLVWSGFLSREQAIEALTEEIYDPDDIDSDAAEDFIDAQIEAKLSDERRWPKVTDCDRLDQLFADLNAKGLAAIQNAGFTISDGQEDVDALCSRRGGPGKSCFGFCFYHGQDLEHAQNGEGLSLAFGHFSGDQAKGVDVGKLIAETARARGLTVNWSGSFNQRITLKPFDWKRRGIPQ